jgi:hypothetical protein
VRAKGEYLMFNCTEPDEVEQIFNVIRRFAARLIKKHKDELEKCMKLVDTEKRLTFSRLEKLPDDLNEKVAKHLEKDKKT